MDDLISWSSTAARLQQQLQFIQKQLATWGLQINLAKSSMICFGAVGSRTIHLHGQTLTAPADETTPVWVMGQPIGPRVTSADSLEALLGRVRKSFHGSSATLKSRADIGRG